MMISGGGPAFTDKKPIEDYEVGSGTAFGAELRDQIDTSFLANIARQGKIGLERQAREDAMRRAKPIHKARTFYDAETARAKVKEAGVDYTIPDEGVQIDEFETMLELRKRQRAEQITVSRRPKTWLGPGRCWRAILRQGLPIRSTSPRRISRSSGSFAMRAGWNGLGRGRAGCDPRRRGRRARRRRRGGL